MAGRAVADHERHVLDARAGERSPAAARQLGVALDAPDVVRQLGEHGGVVARAGADVEHALAAVEREQLAHPRDDERLGDRLPGADRQRDVVPRLRLQVGRARSGRAAPRAGRRARARRRHAAAAARAGARAGRRSRLAYATVAPAAASSSRARSESPGWTSTPRTPARSTVTAKPSREGVERGVLHAVVGRQPDDRDRVDAARAQRLAEAGRVERRVALGARVLALVDDRVERAGVERGVQLARRRCPGRSARARCRPAR